MRRPRAGMQLAPRSMADDWRLSRAQDGPEEALFGAVELAVSVLDSCRAGVRARTDTPGRADRSVPGFEVHYVCQYAPSAPWSGLAPKCE